jgi:hypothetical protein
MIDMQLLGGVLVAVAALAGLAIALAVVMLAAGSAAKPGPAPQGGIRRDLPQQPESEPDDARTLVGVR